MWYNYLRERRKQIKGKCITDPVYEEVNNCHERALVFMHKVGSPDFCLNLTRARFPPVKPSLI